MTKVKSDSHFQGKIGAGEPNPLNVIDANGGIVVGAGYSGSSIAPANGIIVKGKAGFGTDDPITGVQIAKGLALKHINKTDSYTLTTNNCWVSFEGASLTATLPNAVSHPSQIFIIKNVHETNNLTVSTGITVEGVATYYGTIDGQNIVTIGPRECIWVGSGGTNYQILNHYDLTI